MITGTWDRFWVAGALWLAVIAALEYLRLLRVNRLPWWIIHGPVIAWGAVFLVPWFNALRSGAWLVPSGPPTTVVPLSLPATYRYALFALFGLAVALFPFSLVGRRSGAGVPRRPKDEISPGRAFTAVAVLLVLYVISLPSLSNIWTLSGTSGENLYSSAHSSFLSLSIVVLAGVAIGYLARQQPLSWIGTAFYLALLVLTLGSAHRYLVLILILSYLILRRPFRNVRGSIAQGLVLLLTGAAVVWLFGFAGLGQLSFLRSGVSGSSSYANTKGTLSSFDVIGSAEFLFESGAQPGQLHGSSYLALPGELIPHVILGSRLTPPAVQVEEGVFGISTGASAPLWIEGVLNKGGFGDLISMAALAGIWGLAFRRAMSAQGRLGRLAAGLGPVWILIAYQALSRVLLVATIDLFASIIIGLLVWNWIQVERRPGIIRRPLRKRTVGLRRREPSAVTR